jgi:hypothetical protein
MVHSVSRQVVCTTKAGTVRVHTTCLETLCTVIQYSIHTSILHTVTYNSLSVLLCDAQDTRNEIINQIVNVVYEIIRCTHSLMVNPQVPKHIGGFNVLM